MVSIDKQSEDIAGGVDVSLEARDQENTSADPFDTLGAGDQGMMVGFACNETPELMPLSISLAHKLCKKMSDVRKNGDVSFLRPDGKAQVTIEYSHGKPKRVHTVVLSTQHDPNVSQHDIETALFKHVINEVLPKTLIDEANSRLSEKILFGSDYPYISPDRWIAEWDDMPIKDSSRKNILLGNARKILGM